MPRADNTPAGSTPKLGRWILVLILPDVNAEDADVWDTAAAEEEIADMSHSTRDRQLLRDLDRLDRRREAEATDRSAEDETRRQRLQRVLARLSRLEDSRPTYGVPPTQQQSLYDWAPTNESQEESDQAASRRRALYRRHDLRSAAIMQNARTTVRSPSGSQRLIDDANDTQDARSAYRRTYLADSPAQDLTTTPALSSPSPLLESAVKYLDDVRECSSYDDSLCTALDHGLFAPECYDDLITDTGNCSSPQPSSWLAPGAIFRGTQHTTTAVKASFTRPAPVFDTTRASWLGHHPNPYSRSIPPSLSASALSNLTLPPREVQDRWPVKVTLQAIDLQNMTIAGTMEAFDVPSTIQPSTETGVPTPPITTYLEGQIIDLNVHTFLTPAKPNPGPITFPTTSALTDAGYWRNLPPFSSMKSDQDVARAMLSRAQMDEIMSDWIFMRWKERCFIHCESDLCHTHSEHARTGEGDDNDLNHGLTISGFYYVSLRRSDGNIEGLYFDTKTSPYQRLRLAAKSGGTLASWQFK
ncbi:hypothetical protein E4T39_08599 [Aureobasidium subglaciale]|nr:hypothetical protein E4T39_08599 [Aureobasidium subglaciale]